MSKTPPYVVVGLGLFAAAHYVVSPYLHGAAEAPDGPRLASLTVASTGTVTVNSITVVDAITDAEYAAPVVDTRHPVKVMPALPPTFTSLLKSS